MAIINPTHIQEGLIKYIREAVGSRLSDLPSNDPNNILKAVIKVNANGQRPDYPYITVGKVTTNNDAGSWLRHSYVDETTDLPVYVSEQNVTLQVNCYGDDSENILTELRLSSLDDISRDELNTETTAVFQEFTTITYRPQIQETDFIDGAETTANFTAVSSWTPANAGIIEKIDVNGKYLHFEGDTNPIDVTLNIVTP